MREILGDRADHVELTMLLDVGEDLHSFQPTADDMVTISTYDLFLYTGGESDSWVEDALANATNPDLVAMNLMEVLGDGVKTAEVVEGMQESKHHHHHEEEAHHKDAHEHHEDCDHTWECTHSHDDEHIWLSLKHAALLCNAIADILGTIDPEHQEAYAEEVATMELLIEKLVQILGLSFRPLRPCGGRAGGPVCLAVGGGVLLYLFFYHKIFAVTICAAVLSVFCAAAGIITSILAGTPVGATIVAGQIALFALCSLVGWIRRR